MPEKPFLRVTEILRIADLREKRSRWQCRRRRSCRLRRRIRETQRRHECAVGIRHEGPRATAFRGYARKKRRRIALLNCCGSVRVDQQETSEPYSDSPAQLHRVGKDLDSSILA